jgi:poly(A) polymerase
MPGLAQLSRERVWSELKKLLAAPSSALAAFVTGGFFTAVTDGGGDLAALAAADAVWPQADALTRLAVLAVRGEADMVRLDAKLRLSAAERRRLEQAEGARAFLAAGEIDHARFQCAAFRHGAEGARDGLLMAAPGGDAAMLSGWFAESAPVSPFKGADVLALGLAAGPRVGEVVRLAEQIWEGRGYPQDQAERQAILREAVRRADPREG